MTKTLKLVAGTALGLALVAGAGAGAAVAREQGPQGPGGFMGQAGPGGRGMRGPGGPGGRGGMAQGLRGLDLTDSQREQVKAAMESHKAEFAALGTKLRAAREALGTAVNAGTFDEGAVRQKAADLAIVEADGAVLRAKAHAEVWALLTPEQQAKAKARQAEREARRGQRQERRQQRQQQ